MAIENGCHKLTAQNITDGNAVIPTTHTTASGQATCLSKKPLSALRTTLSLPNNNPVQQRLPACSASSGDLSVVTKGLNEDDLVCWISDGV
ncbi:MAG: hypothetical protein HRT76_14780 [Halieaceae bacterium]|nr:hypothetical protein [Halieaceae bacterium]